MHAAWMPCKKSVTYTYASLKLPACSPPAICLNHTITSNTQRTHALGFCVPALPYNPGNLHTSVTPAALLPASTCQYPWLLLLLCTNQVSAALHKTGNPSLPSCLLLLVCCQAANTFSPHEKETHSQGRVGCFSAHAAFNCHRCKRRISSWQPKPAAAAADDDDLQVATPLARQLPCYCSCARCCRRHLCRCLVCTATAADLGRSSWRRGINPRRLACSGCIICGSNSSTL